MQQLKNYSCCKCQFSLVICTYNYIFDIIIFSVNKGLFLGGESMVKYANEGFVFGVKFIHKLRFSN
jgi:hypothetical protein